eukprot:TRINITY_DN37982_c0_g1_i1.p1 TRINITY_DN37982_c0_g1~~TRINITY_DN37982_c0_g1_i1.p1  ORF type:complete len:410 (+),score=68.48 TRINITY_DN37982_c0_g1_i1:81-1310(+)
MLRVALAQGREPSVDVVDDEIVTVEGCDLGFIPGQPPHVLQVEPGCVMESGGIQPDDILVAIDELDINGKMQHEVLTLLQTARLLDFKRIAGDNGSSQPQNGPLSLATPKPASPALAEMPFASVASKASAMVSPPLDSGGVKPFISFAKTLGDVAPQSLSKSGAPVMTPMVTPTIVPAMAAPKAVRVISPPAGVKALQSMSAKAAPAMAPATANVVAPIARASAPTVIAARQQAGVSVIAPRPGVAAPVAAKGGGKGSFSGLPKMIPPRVEGAPTPTLPASMTTAADAPVVVGAAAIEASDERESLPADHDVESWVELLRDGYCQHLRWQNSCSEPPPFPRVMQRGIAAGEKIPEGSFGRDALNLQFKMLLGMRGGVNLGSAGFGAAGDPARAARPNASNANVVPPKST